MELQASNSLASSLPSANPSENDKAALTRPESELDPPSEPIQHGKVMKKSDGRRRKPAIPPAGWWVIGTFVLVLAAVIICLFDLPKRAASNLSRISWPSFKTVTPAPAVPNPIINLPISPLVVPPPVPVKIPSFAEMILARPSTGQPSSHYDKVEREIATLTMKETLWIPDFSKLVSLTREDFPKSALLSPVLFAIFGKPDSEYGYTEQRRFVDFLPPNTVHFTNYTYFDRILNPTTEKKEHLTVQFSDGFFVGVMSPSGHSWPP